MTPPLKHSRTYPATASALAFPLGGIGTGNVSLGARGELRDWEIFNSPAKGNSLPNTFFALWARSGDGTPVAKVLEASLPAPHLGSHGYHPQTAAGLPRLAGAEFRGEYPFATITFDDPDLPVAVELSAYTPLIPLDPADSGLPCAILTYRLTNRTAAPVSLALIGSLTNPVGGIALDRFGNQAPGGVGGNLNTFRDESGLRGLHFTSTQYPAGDLRHGDLSLATTHEQVTVKRAWLRAGWFDYLRDFWSDLTADGLLTDLGYDDPTEPGKTDTGSLGLLDTLAPGDSRDYRFILTWSFPNRPDSWREETDRLTRNHYATRFADSWAVARHVADNLARLESGTQQFHDALFNSTLPEPVLDALSANIVPLRSTTCFWLEDGRFFGWEGCFDDAGCCAGSCTHVWSYAQTLAYLFPSLEREMRRIEFAVETDERGHMEFRTFKTFGEKFVWGWGDQSPEAAIDGQMGSILRAYREWQLSGDRDWLANIWPGIKRAILFADRQWDTDQDGVPDGKQHNTYDMEFYGPNPLGAFYYLAALRAVEELAVAMGEPTLATRAHAAFERGQRRAEELLWNGEFYVQRLDDVDAYRYQHGLGCLTDQLLGQWHARLLGLGSLAAPDRERSALAAIVRHNFKDDFRHHVNTQRTYVLNDESGLLMCSWPNGGEPRFPFPYSDEVWTGCEYHVAAHLFATGQPADGLRIVAAVRARHDGTRRSPWNEVECGNHYARSMSSWSLLLAISGFTCDLGKGELHFAPQLAASTDPDRATFLWTTDRAWGTYTQTRNPDNTWTPTLDILGGNLDGIRIHACGQTWTL